MPSDNKKLREFRNKNNWTQQELADKLGIKLSRLSMVECGKNKLSLELKELLKERCNYDIDNDCYTFDKYYHHTQAVPIPYYNIKASANPTGDFIILDYSEDECVWFDQRWLKNILGVEPINCSILKTKGDSMLPDIQDNDLLLIDNSDTSIINNKTYIVELPNDNSLLVKKVIKDVNGLVSLVSNNPKYPVRVLNEADNALIKGRVVYNLSKGNI